MLKITIETTGAAFEDSPLSTIRYCLRGIAESVDETHACGPNDSAKGNILDPNGNTVGSWEYKPD